VEVLFAVPRDGPDQVVLSCEIAATTAEKGACVPPHDRLTEPESVAVTLPHRVGIKLTGLVEQQTRNLVEFHDDAEARDAKRRRSQAADSVGVAGRSEDVVARARRLFADLTEEYPAPSSDYLQDGPYRPGGAEN
jgi:hypothetical protein